MEGESKYSEGQLKFLWAMLKIHVADPLVHSPKIYSVSNIIMELNSTSFNAMGKDWLKKLIDDQLIVGSTDTPMIAGMKTEGEEYIKGNTVLFKDFEEKYSQFIQKLTDPEFFEKVRRNITSDVGIKHSIFGGTEYFAGVLGLVNVGLLGYLSKEPADGSKQLFEGVVSATSDQIITIDPDKEGVKEEDLTVGFISLGYTSPSKTSLKLRRFFFQNSNADHFDHLICTNPIESKLYELGYQEETDQYFRDIYLYKEPGKDKVPLYLYSSHPSEKVFNIHLPNAFISDKTAFLHSDTLAEKDQLGRQQLTDEVVGLIEELFNNGDHKGAYSILLNGEWGAGKSSMLKFLESKLKGDHNWRITKYNAWENQQFKDPWWILINAISKQASEEGFDGAIASHRAWKFGIQYRNKLWALLLIVLFLASGLLFINSASENNFKFDFGVISGLLGLIGALTSAILGLTNNFFFRNVSHEDLKERFADHPFKKIRERFKEISADNKLAIFIDDLDRCEPEPTVKLLEGIQTLFKEDSNVLYIIAADAQWLIRCFDKHYEDFAIIAAPGHSIGEKFLEKSFQLKVTVPIPNDAIFDQYYDELIRAVKKKEPVSSAQASTIPGEQSNPTQVTTDTPKKEPVQEPISEKSELDKVEKELPKYLTEFKDAGVPRNPRQMKRFINQYIIMRATLKAEGNDFETLSPELQDKAVRYLLFTMQFPKLAHYVKVNKLKLDQIASGKFDKLKVKKDISKSLQALTLKDRKLLEKIFKTGADLLTFSHEDLILLQSV